AQLRELHVAETPDIARDQRRALDVAFHEVIAVASRNDLLFDAVRDIRVRLAPGLDLIQGPWPERRAESRGGHERLLAGAGRPGPGGGAPGDARPRRRHGGRDPRPPGGQGRTPGSVSYDVHTLRTSQFPITSRCAYLDNASFGPLPRACVEAAEAWLRD